MDNLEALKKIFTLYNSFLLTTHVNADGDGIGSILGLGKSLKKLGKKVSYLVPGTPPEHFSFLNGFEEINTDTQKEDDLEVLVILDAPNIERMEGVDLATFNFKEVVRIDHHVGTESRATVNYVKVGYPSTTCILWEIIKALELPIDEDIATAIYTGVLTDTGSFRFNNTQPVAFEVAKELVEHGANPYYISRMVYEMDTLSHLKLLGVSLLRLEIIKNLGFSYITQDDFKNFDATEEDTEGIVDFLRKEKDVEVVLFLRELKEGGYKGSLRSKNHIDVRRIAEIFGGGGHKEASGFKANLPKEKILEIVIKELENGEKKNTI